MNKSLFISDIHLSEHDHEVKRKFDYFLSHIAIQAEKLFILGDLFDAWVGDDDKSSFNQDILSKLELLSSQLPVYFMAGNRDVLIGKDFIEQTGLQKLNDPYTLTLYGKQIVLTHGDYLCTHDTFHQYYRKCITHPFVQKLWITFPLAWRRLWVQKLRHKSQNRNQMIPTYWMDVDNESVHKLINQNKGNILIHGHTHKPKIHPIHLQSQKAYRVVLGAWHNKAEYLEFQDNGLFRLLTLE